MRSTIVASLCFAVCLATACSNETGLLINTSSNDNLATRIDSLRYYVGQDTIGAPGYFSDDNPLEDVLLEGRNIADEPYKLLLRPSDESTEIIVAVLAYNAQGQSIGFGRLAEPVGFLSGQVLEWDVAIAPIDGGVFEAENDCLKFTGDTGETIHIGRAGDQDCDGYSEEEGDCDDLNPELHPGQREDCNNNIDDDCNGLIDAADTEDRDQDTFFVCGPEDARDCNNDDNTVYPGAPEICDGHDNNCNFLCDEGKDPDLDGVSDCGSVIDADGQCIDMGDPDCGPEDNEVYPGNREVCDGKDNDCAGGCDDDPDLDPDRDGYTSCGSVVGECGLDDALVDCAPEDENVHPGTQELCDGADQDCIEGNEPEASPCFVDDGQGACRQGLRNCNNGILGDVCVVSREETVDPAFCDSYTGCQLPGDPLGCVLAGDEIDVQAQETCQVVSGAGILCPENIVQILLPGANTGGTECTFTLIGNDVQQGYAISLLGSAAGDPAPSIASCSAFLKVTPLPGAGEALIAINYQIPGDPDVVIGVRLRARRRLACESLKGLMCETWPNVSPN